MRYEHERVGDTSEHERRVALADFVNCYNHDRPHTALGGRSPISRTAGSDYPLTFDQPPEPLVDSSSASRTSCNQCPETPQLAGSDFPRQRSNRLAPQGNHVANARSAAGMSFRSALQIAVRPMTNSDKMNRIETQAAPAESS
ncbi:integrase core domain-containing protein [Streptomyces sp. ET3-23]|uniref:integrase core domain-containing protein n=1 Tax=Streptomyces sp. ET3-23 TaxID=2885643 RepID=UPI0035AF4B5C